MSDVVKGQSVIALKKINRNGVEIAQDSVFIAATDELGGHIMIEYPHDGGVILVSLGHGEWAPASAL